MGRGVTVGGDRGRRLAPAAVRRGAARGPPIKVASWNIGSMNGRDGEVVEALERRRVDFCCVQEHRRDGRYNELIQGRREVYKFFWSGGTGKQGGVGVLLAEHWVDRVLDAQKPSDRVMWVKLRADGFAIRVIAAYAPQSGLSDEVKDAFWATLTREVAAVDGHELLVLGGDLNGHVGRFPDGYDGVHGGWSVGTRNREGERILDFADSLGLVLCNTIFRKRPAGLVTYSSGGAETQIDFILVRRQDRRLVRDVNALTEECVTQHKLIVGEVKLDRPKVRKQRYTPKRRVWKLREEDNREVYREELRARAASNVPESQEVSELYRVLKENLLGAADTVCGWTRGPPKRDETWWWNAEVDRAVEEKRRLFQVWKSGGDKRAYLQAKGLARQAVFRAKTAAQSELLDNLNMDEGRNAIFKVASQSKKECRDVVGEQCVRGDDGVVAVGGPELREVWRVHHSRVANEEFDWDRGTLTPAAPVLGPPPLITEEVVRRAIRDMKNGKAAGCSGLSAELLKAADDDVIGQVTDLLNAVVRERRIPDDWKRSVVVNVFKGKGDAQERGNYRGIKLLDQVMKLMERVVAGMIRKRVDIDETQFGFTPGRGTADAVFILRQLIEKYAARNKELVLVFVDLEKAFDRVPRDVLWWALRSLRVDEWLVGVVLAMYEGAVAQVRVGGELSGEFPVTVGVYQGSALSPLLFLVVLEAISREYRRGLPKEMLYADDLVLIAENMEEAEDLYRGWRDGLKVKGLRVNVDKTKVMICRPGAGRRIEMGNWPCAVCGRGVGVNSIRCTQCEDWVHARCSGVGGPLAGREADYVCPPCLGVRVVDDLPEFVELAGERLECVREFRYLGDVISADGRVVASSVARVRSGWKCFGMLRALLTKRALSLRVKGRLYVACVRSAMLYGTETWPVLQDDVDRLKRAEMRMVRWMCGVRRCPGQGGEGPSNAALRGRLGIECIGEVLRKKRLSWYGHVSRMEEDSAVKKVMNMVVRGGTVGRGRPRRTWQRLVQEDIRRWNLATVDPGDRVRWAGALRLQ